MYTGRINDPETRFRDAIKILSIVVLIAPYGMIIDRVGSYIIAFFWTIHIRNYDVVVSPLIPIDFFSLLFLFSRIIFIYLFARLYHGKSTKKTVISVGVVIEYSLVFMAILQGSLVFAYPDWPYVMIGLPIPILLCSTLVILHYWPLPLQNDRWLDESPQEESKSASSPNPQ